MDVGAYVVLGAGAGIAEGLDDALCCVVRVDGHLRGVRRIGASTGELEGAEAVFPAAELHPAAPAALRRCEALRTRSAIARWRQAVADDDEDVDSLARLVEAAELLADLVIDGGATEVAELAVCGYVSDLDSAQVVEIDTTEAAGRVRVLINEGVIYDGYPLTGEPGPACSPHPAAEASQNPASRHGGIDDIAARVDPTKARYAVARACAELGRELDWDAGMFNKIREAIEPAAPAGCPGVADQSAAAVAFWRNAIDR